MSEALRRDAVTCALAGIAAVDPSDLVTHALGRLRFTGALSLVAVGKAAGPMASAAISALAGTIRRGVVISPQPIASGDNRLEYHVGGHPLPNEHGVAGANAIVKLLGDLRPGETLLCLVSGGASSLMTLPADGLTLDDVSQTATLLMRAGATIDELNCVRKHLDRLKGGRLASLAFPSPVVALVLSDVIGDSLATIASGPTVGDPTTTDDAIAVLRKHDLLHRVPSPILAHLERTGEESPKPGDPRLASTDNRIIGSNITAATASCAQARSLGYAARVVTTSLAGEASRVGAEIVLQTVQELRRENRPVALVFAGEPTVTVRGGGSGGRNQELALGAAIAMDGLGQVAVASLGTDGVDGPTDAAGAVGDGDSLVRARAIGLDANALLAANDSHAFWKALGGLVRTGPTGTNVMDVVVALARPATA